MIESTALVLEWHDVLAFLVGVAGVVWMSVRASIGLVLSRLDTMQGHIDSAHKKLDEHIVHWHRHGAHGHAPGGKS